MAERRYDRLDPDQIVQTAGRLSERIGARFPESGLHGVSGQLCETAAQARARAEWIAQPLVPLRVATGALIAFVLVASVAAVVTLEVEPELGRLGEALTLLEAAPT